MGTPKTLGPEILSDPRFLIVRRVDYLFDQPTVNPLDLDAEEALEVIQRTLAAFKDHLEQFQGVTPVRDLAARLKLQDMYGGLDGHIRLIPIFDPVERNWQELFKQLYLSTDGEVYEVLEFDRPHSLHRLTGEQLKDKLKDEAFRAMFLQAFTTLSLRTSVNKKRAAGVLEVQDRVVNRMPLQF